MHMLKFCLLLCSLVLILVFQYTLQLIQVYGTKAPDILFLVQCCEAA